MFRMFGIHLSSWSLVLVAGDLCIFCISLLAGLHLNPRVGYVDSAFFLQHKLIFINMGMTYLMVCYIADLYDYYEDYRLPANMGKIILTVLFGTIGVIIIIYFSLNSLLSRYLLIIQASSFAVLIVLWRYSFSAIALPMRLQRQVIIIGAGKAGVRILYSIRQRAASGLMVHGFVDDDPKKVGLLIEGTPVLGNSNQLEGIIKKHQISLVIIAITHEKSNDLLNKLTSLYMNGCKVMDMPHLYEFLVGKIPIDHVSDLWFYVNNINGMKRIYTHLKNILESLLAVVWLLFTFPIWFLISVAIKMDSSGPIFFKQSRLGIEGKPFQILKFRTMIHDNDNGAEATWTTTSKDPRITRVGGILRKLHLDELPQLINVLKGEMGIIGPRAEWDIFARESLKRVPYLRPGRRASDPPGHLIQCGYKEQIPFYSYRLLVKPGITGWAQVNMPMAGSSPEDLKEKLEYDLYYVKNMGFFLDMAILLKTVRIVLFGRGK